MFCASCSKLARLVTSRFCIRCNGKVLDNISVLCEFCSNSEQKCSVCLKKVDNKPKKYKGCGSCGKK